MPDESFYQRLTRLFRSGPAIRRKIKGQNYKNFYDNAVIQNNLGYYGASSYKREASPFSVLGAYGLLDRMSRYCLTGDTLIATNTKQGSIRIDELAHLYETNPLEKYHTFAYDKETNAIVLAEISKAFYTKTEKVCEVHLDNDKVVRCTEDHRFMLRDGTYMEAKNLKADDALMPFYRTKIQKYKNKSCKVKAIVLTSVIEKVYDLTIEGYHNFALTNGVVVHNSEFSEMEFTAEIAGALDIYADESCASDENGRSFHIFSENPQVQRTLEELFYEVANIEFDDRRWFRNLVKNGDFFVYVEVVPDYGVIKVEPIPVNEVEREEGFDPNDPYAVRFKLLTRGGKYLENWQILHFRILANDLFLPYGSSFLEPARRVWRQLIMMEDAMLVYRVVRSPERRVFYIDVSAIHPNDIPTYMEAVKETMRGSSVVDKLTGRQDIRYNPVAIDEDYFLPSRPNSQTKIESLAGGQHVSATEDVEYIQKKLIAALKVPRAYLTFDESLSCLTGETEIQLLNGTSVPIKELAEKFESGELKEEWCYSAKPTGEIVPGKITKAWATKQVDSIYKVHLDSGEVISCTENHPFMMRDGTYKRADELSPLDSLMPLYTKKSSKEDGDRLSGYEMILDNSSGEWNYTHKIVNEECAKANGGHTVGKQRVIHHKNFNKLDNSPSNLEEMTWYGHRKLHSQNLETTLMRPDVIAKREPLRLAALAGPKHRAQKSVQMTAQMADPNSLLRTWIHSDKLRETVSANMKESWLKPEYRNLKIEQNKEIWTSPEIREKLSGENHWATKKKKEYDLEWLVSFCKENDITEKRYFKYSAKSGAPIGMRTVEYIFKENNITGWRQFQKDYLKKNHKVVMIAVERCNDPIWVYDLEVENLHNFTSQGIVLHNSKATLSQEDVRFSRTISNLQKIMLAELNKLAIIHLFSKGFDGDDLLDFELKFSNPSTVAVQQKLQLTSTRVETAAKAWELSKETGMMDMEYIQREILGFRMDDIIKMRLGSQQDQIRIAELKALAEKKPETDRREESVVDPFDSSNYELPASNSATQQLPPPKQPNTAKISLPASGNEVKKLSVPPGKAPIKANQTPNLDAAARRQQRRIKTGASALGMPDFKKMLDVGNRYAKDIYDMEFLKKPLEEIFSETRVHRIPQSGIPKELASALRRLSENMRQNREMIDLEFITEAQTVEPEDELLQIEKELLDIED